MRVYEVHQGLHVIHRGVLQDAVAEIEDMARPPAHAVQDAPGLPLDLGGRGEQHHGTVPRRGTQPGRIARATAEYRIELRPACFDVCPWREFASLHVFV